MDGIVGSSDTYPSPAQLSGELERVRAGKRRRSVLRGLLRTLVLCAAAAALAATLWMPVLRVYGASMTPTLREGEVVICLRSKDLQPGDLAAFRLGGKLLLKRCIAGPGQWVDMEEDGTVLVDGVALEEPYLSEKALGACDLTLPFQVPEGVCAVTVSYRYQKLAGDDGLLRKCGLWVLDQLNQLDCRRLSEGDGVLPVGGQAGLDHLGEIDAVISNH